MKRSGKYLPIIFGVVAMLIADLYIYTDQSINSSHKSERRLRIADACYAMLHSSLTNDDDIAMDDPRIPKVIRALHPFHIDVIQNFDVEFYRTGRPSEYYLTRVPDYTSAWVLCDDGRSPRSGGGGRELARIEPQQIVHPTHRLHQQFAKK